MSKGDPKATFEILLILQGLHCILYACLSKNPIIAEAAQAASDLLGAFIKLIIRITVIALWLFHFLLSGPFIPHDTEGPWEQGPRIMFLSFSLIVSTL